MPHLSLPEPPSAHGASSRPRFLLCLALLLSPLSAAGAVEDPPFPTRTQQIALSKGWNAVFLEVDPADPTPEKVMAGLPVDKVATLFENPTTHQFVSDPTIGLANVSGWGVWYAPDLPEAFLKSLGAIEGNRAYLVHAREACQWRVNGRVVTNTIDWRADAFNLVGFPVRTPGGPTFAEFFAGSSAHAGQPVYRLANGRWRKVVQPSNESIRSGEAFWIFCKGPSDYQGPLRVEPPARQGLLLGGATAGITLRNESRHPLTPRVEHQPSDGPPVPLSVVVRSFGDPQAAVSSVAVPKPAGAWVQDLPPLENGAALALPFERRAGDMLRARQGSLLRITTDLGTECWVPVLGFRSDLGG